MSNLHRKQSSDLGTLHDAMHRLVEDSLYLPKAGAIPVKKIAVTPKAKKAEPK